VKTAKNCKNGKEKGSKLPAEPYLSYDKLAVEAPAEEYPCDEPVAEALADKI
jgi:hypothetical protein